MNANSMMTIVSSAAVHYHIDAGLKFDNASLLSKESYNTAMTARQEMFETTVRGSKVIVIEYKFDCTEVRIETITDVTPTQIHVGTTRFSKFGNCDLIGLNARDRRRMTLLPAGSDLYLSVIFTMLYNYVCDSMRNSILIDLKTLDYNQLLLISDRVDALKPL